MRGRSHATFLLGVLVVIILASAVRYRSGDLDRMLGTDEADYVRAMSYGAAANYLGTRERSGVAFTMQVVSDYRETGWARPFQRDWSAGDAAGLRHYHPPLALYPLGVLAGAGVRDEGTLRLVPIVTGVLACVGAVVLAFLLLAGTPGSVRKPMAVTAGLAGAVSPYLVAGSLAIGPHAAFSLLATLTLICLTRAAQLDNHRWWLAGCAAFGLTALTVPYWALLVPAVLWSWWGLRVPHRSVRLLMGGAIVATAAAAIAWPPMLLTAAFVKPALMYAGIVLNPLVDDHTPGAWLLELVRAHPLVTALALVGLAAIPAMGRERRQAFAPVAIFVLGFVVLNLRVGHMKPLYAGDMVVPLAAAACALAGLAVVRFGRSAAGPLAVGIVASAAMITAVAITRAPSAGEASDWRAALAALNEELAGDRVLVTPRPAGAMVHYYLPDATTRLDSSDTSDVAGLKVEVDDGDLDVILRWGAMTEPGGLAHDVIGDWTPDGSTRIEETPVSWWRLERVRRTSASIQR